MAGYFNPDGLDDPEVCDLSDDEHRAWVIFCLERHPRCGIFKPNLRLWCSRSRTPLENLPACMDAYEKLGWIKRDPEKGYVWIINYTRHQSKQADWLAKAREEAETLISDTFLAQDWLDFYSHIKTKSHIISKPKSEPKSEPICPPISGPTDRTDSLQDRQTEQTALPPAEQKVPPTLPEGSPNLAQTFEQPLLLADNVTEEERLILKELKEIPSHSFDYNKDLAYIRKLAVDFPDVDLLGTMQKMSAWLSDHPTKKSGHLRMRNFCETASKDSGPYDNNGRSRFMQHAPMGEV